MIRTRCLQGLQIAILILCMLHAACKRDDAAVMQSVFEITNAEDVVYDSALLVSPLKVGIKLVSGPAEPVTLSVEGLPAGVPAPAPLLIEEFPAVGRIPVERTAALTEGTYPIRLLVRSKSFSGSLNLKLVVLPAGLDYYVSLAPTWDFSRSAYFSVKAVRAGGRPVTDLKLIPVNQPSQLEASPISVTSPASMITSKLFFFERSVAPAGEYPISIQISSEGHKKAVDVLLHVPAWQGYVAGGRLMRGTMQADKDSGRWILFSNLRESPDYDVIVKMKDGPLPSSDGVFQYSVSDVTRKPTVDIIYRYYDNRGAPHTYYSDEASTKLTVSRMNGKSAITVNNIRVRNPKTGEASTISINATER